MVKKKIKISLLLAYVLTLFALAFFVFPIFYYVSLSFRYEKDVLNFFPTEYTLDNYITLLTKGVHEESPYDIFYRPLLNSIIIASTSTLITIFVTVLAAYAVDRFRFKGRNGISFFILSLYMTPPIVTLIPLWDIAATLHLIDTHIFLIWCYTMFGIPLSFWMLRSFVMTVPSILEEAAMVDGCSRFRALIYVTLPLLRPGIAAASILVFLLNWGEYMFAGTLTSHEAVTIPVAIAKFGFWLTVDWTTMATMSAIAMVPILILAAFIQKYIVSGLTLGAVRG
jgi:multiple sugar transport system permease protein